MENKWQKYYKNYKKKTFVISFIEWVNRNYFTPMFMNEFYKITKRKKELSILEPGCGSGLMSSYLAKNNKVTVLDLSKNALHVAKYNFNKTRANGKFVLGNLHDMQFSDNSFDIVWNQGVIEHFKNPVPAMKEMLRVTKRKGYLIIFVPAFLSPLHIIWLFLKMFNLKRLWPFDEQDFFSAKTFKNYAQKAGFKNIKIRRLWFNSLGFSQVGYCKK